MDLDKKEEKKEPEEKKDAAFGLKMDQYAKKGLTVRSSTMRFLYHIVDLVSFEIRVLCKQL